MATPLAPAWFVLCWQCVLPGRIVAKGQWLWRLGGAPAVTLTVPNGRTRRNSSAGSLAAPSTHCAAHSLPCSAQAWDRARPRPGWEVGVFLTTMRGRPQVCKDHHDLAGGRLKAQVLCDLRQSPSPLWPLLTPIPFTGQQPKLLRDLSLKGLVVAQPMSSGRS